MIKPLTSEILGTDSAIALEDGASQIQYQSETQLVEKRIIRLLLAGEDGENVLAKIAEVLRSVFGVNICLIVATSNQNQSQIEHWCAVDYSVEQKHQRQLIEHPALTSVLASQPLAIADLQSIKTQELLVGGTQEQPTQAVLAINTTFHSTVNGIIILGRSQHHDWLESEKEMLKTVSDSVAIAISQVQLKRQLHTAAQYKILINEMTEAIRSDWDIEHILRVTIAQTVQALQVDQGLILLLKYADPRLARRQAGASARWQQQQASDAASMNSQSPKRVPRAIATIASQWFSSSKDLESTNNSNPSGEIDADRTEETSRSDKLTSFKLSECYWCEQAFINAPEPVAIADRHNQPQNELETENSPIIDINLMPALLMVPLESQNSVLGFLVLQHSQPRCWQPEELDLVKWVSAQASTAIIQSQTLRQVQALVEERTAQLQRSLEVQAKLYEKTRQQIDQLRQLNQLKDEFLSTMSHELKTPLTSMSVAIELLRQPQLSPEMRVKYLDILKQQCNQEINLINDLLALQKLESNKSPIEPQKVDLKILLWDLAQSFEQKWADKGLTVAVELPTRSLLIQTDPDSLNRIMDELLTNAGKYSDPDTTVRISAAHQVEGQLNQVVLNLTNIGPGISPTEIDHIFDKFRRGQGVTQQAVQGTGLGLALVKSLVQHINGTIAVSSCPTENTQSCDTCFTLTLPQFFDSTKI